MSANPIQVRELAAWGFDAFSPRGEDPARTLPVTRPAYMPRDPRCKRHPLLDDPRLTAQAARPELLQEMQGLTWDLAVVDLRELLAFQRRLSFDPAAPPLPQAADDDAAELLRVCFGPVKAVEYTVGKLSDHSMALHSPDPNFHLRLSAGAANPVTPSSGSPFLEVASYRGRWFLRDGYHRAYHLLRAGIYVVPAVVVRAGTLAELGATQPRFFAEDVLFSADPPRVADFLDDRLTCEYTRPRLIQTVRLTLTTHYAPEATGDQR